MAKKDWYEWLALILLIIGGVNWGLTAFGFNLVSAIFGTGVLLKIVYGLVGLSGVWAIVLLFQKKM